MQVLQAISSRTKESNQNVEEASRSTAQQRSFMNLNFAVLLTQVGDEELVAAEARKAASQAINAKPAKQPVASIVKQMWMKPTAVRPKFFVAMRVFGFCWWFK
jgi:hypothetical protein